MVTQLLADGDLKQSKKSTTPTLEPIYQLRNFVNSAQHWLTKAFAREENVELSEVPDAVQPVVQHQEAEDQRTTTA